MLCILDNNAFPTRHLQRHIKSTDSSIVPRICSYCSVAYPPNCRVPITNKSQSYPDVDQSQAFRDNIPTTSSSLPQVPEHTSQQRGQVFGDGHPGTCTTQRLSPFVNQDQQDEGVNSEDIELSTLVHDQPTDGAAVLAVSNETFV